MSKHVSSTATGKHGEDIAVQALRANGYQIIDQNWRCRLGEIDIVARDGDEWVFVEVKTRQGLGYGTPEEAVTGSKQSKLLRLGTAYLARHGVYDAGWRVDVVAIELGQTGKVQRLEIYRNAVVADD